MCTASGYICSHFFFPIPLWNLTYPGMLWRAANEGVKLHIFIRISPRSHTQHKALFVPQETVVPQYYHITKADRLWFFFSFFFFKIRGCLYVSLVVSKLLDPNDSPASASWVAGTFRQTFPWPTWGCPSREKKKKIEQLGQWDPQPERRSREGGRSPRDPQVRAGAEPSSRARAGAQGRPHIPRTWRRSQARGPPTPAPAEAPSPPFPLRRTRAQVREAAPAGGPCSRGPAMEYIRTPKVGGLGGGGREGGMLSLSARGCPAGSWTASEGGAGGSLASPCALRGRPFSCSLTGLAGANLLSLGEGGRFVGCAVDAGVGRRERTLIVSWVTRFFYLFGSRLSLPPQKK